MYPACIIRPHIYNRDRVYGLVGIIFFFFVVENVGNGGRFLVSMAENVVVESSLLVAI